MELKDDIDCGIIQSMTWGGPRELVTGSEYIKLWEVNVDESRAQVLWRKRLANPAIVTLFSPDKCLLATMAEYDPLIKIWRRSSFDRNYVEFDFTYLPHPQRVLEMRWRQLFGYSQSIENTLYTYCEDGVVRIWSPYDSMDIGNLQLCANIDTRADANGAVLIIDNGDISRAIEGAVIKITENGSKQPSPGVDNLLGLGQKLPEILLIFYFDGTYSAYSIENVGLHKEKLAVVTKLFGKKRLVLSNNGKLALRSPTKLKLQAYLSPGKLPQDRQLCILIHDFDGMIVNYSTDIIDLLDLSSGGGVSKTMRVRSIFTGHKKSVQSIVRSADGNSLLSRSRFSENILWKPEITPQGITLKRTCLIDTRGTALKSVIINDGAVAIFTDNHELVLWDCRSLNGREAAATTTGCDAPLMGMFLLPESDESEPHLVLVFDDKTVQLWSFNLSSYSLVLQSSSKFPCNDDIYLVVPVDPVGWRVKLSGHMDVFQRQVLSTVSANGTTRVWTASVKDSELTWLQTSMVETEEIKVRKAQVSSTRKLVIANQNGSSLFIWDLQNNLRELAENFDTKHSISDLDWTTTPDGQCVLGVGFAQQVILYCQQRFDYTNKTPSWVPFRKVDISGFTPHSIGDSIWLKNGTFVVGVGNQFFIQDEKVDIRDETTRQWLGSRNTISFVQNDVSIFDVCALLNGPLPMYHPQLLIQSIFSDKIRMVKQILVRLVKELRYATVLEPSMVADVPSMLGIDPEYFTGAFDQTLDGEIFDTSVSDELLDRLQKVSLPYLTRHQQITLVSVVEALVQMDQHIRSLDDNGIKYLLGYKLYNIHRGSQESMTVRDFNWALHSDSQNVLMDLIEAKAATTLWPAMREVGIAYWARTEQLTELFEILGRNYFNYEGKRDPVKCTLYYLALKKKQVLVGLWRTASWNREQDKTIKLLSNDFTQPRWRSAAQKNAFALLGKHRYEYAASFFLLGDSLKDAVNVIVKNMNDLSLAIAVARVYEGDSGPVLKELINSHIIPRAKQNGDHWLFSWALWVSGKRKDAIEGLIRMGTKAHGMSYLTDDPVLVILYRYLRDQRNKSHRSGKLTVTAKDELGFVGKMISIYNRMGCDVLALDLLQGWTFMEEGVERGVNGGRRENTMHIKPKKSPTLNRRQSIFAIETAPPPPSMKELVAAPAAAFQEPDMSAFDFGM